MTRGPVRPVKVQPRLDPKPWGGRLLEAWGIRLPPSETIGEALLTAPEATVATGALSGTPLSTPARIPPPGSARRAGGNRRRPIFPLLVKLIDGQADLSIQIHPNDRAAAAAGLGTGKTEAYHVLAAAPGRHLSRARSRGDAGGVRGLVSAGQWVGRRVPASGSRRARDDGADPGGDPPRSGRRHPPLRDPAALQRHLPARRLGTG